MKTSSKIVIAAAAVGVWLLAKGKKAISGIGSVGTKYVVRFIPKRFWQEVFGVWMTYPYIGLQNTRDHATRFNSRREAEMCAQEVMSNYLEYDYKGYEIMKVNDHDEDRVREAIDTVLSYDDGMRYQLLDRMRSDCDYYLGNGNRHPQYLWMSMDEQGQIDVMRALWDSFDEKPEWLTREKIDWYADQMGVE